MDTAHCLGKKIADQDTLLSEITPADTSPILPVKRRSVLKMATLGGLASIAGGIALPFSMSPIPQALAQTGKTKTKDEKIVWNSCLVNCGSRCLLKCHVVDETLVSIRAEDVPDEFGMHQSRPCLRGRSARRRVYNPDRLKYPMKRVGKRGEGRFERISWDEAIKIVGDKLRYTIDTYGNESIYYHYGSGTTGYNFGGRNACRRFLRVIGGYLDYYGTYSTAQLERAMPFMYGPGYEGVHRSLMREMENARLVVSFGYNPSETRMSGGGDTYRYSESLSRGKARLICIDPRYTDSMLGKEDEWIPIRPGTDAALAEAIAYVLITENMVDEQFLETYCIGYDEKTLPASAPKNGSYKAHVLGEGADGLKKTPAWASKITGIPEARIIKLAREIGLTKPVFITQGWGIQRQANGEQAIRAVCMLPLLTGNIGLPGTNLGDEPGNYAYALPSYPMPDNLVKAKIPVFLWTDAITRGKEMTALTDGIQGVEKLNQPIKFFWNYSGNTLLNQHSDINTTRKILEDDKLCEFILVIDTHMTPSAMFADILLPDVTNYENSDIINTSYATGELSGVLYLSAAIKPMFECKTAYEMCTALARHLGVEEKFTEGRSYEDWLQWAYKQMQTKDPQLPDLETGRKQGMVKRPAPEKVFIGLKKFREDPKANPLKTPSGKIEIYSEALAGIAATWTLPPGDVITPIPQYVATWEGAEDTETRKNYPLQLFGYHTKGRAHSTYHNVDLLRQAVTDALWINPVDAAARQIKDGDMVRVSSLRGEVRLPAKVTPRIMPGVTAMGEGAWYKPDAKGLDMGGCVNMLTSQRPSPLAKGNPQHTNLVQVAKL